MENKRLVYNRLEILFFFLYVVILAGERLAALIGSVRLGGAYALTSGNPFNYIAYSITAASLLAGVALFIKPAIEMISAWRSGECFSFETRSKGLLIASAALLFGGMMHTGLTIAFVQFIAYGFLIGAMVVVCVENISLGVNRLLSISSVVYLTLFAMAIPVCYLSFMKMPLRVTFFVFEFVAVFALVPCFFRMLGGFLKNGTDNFHFQYPALLLILSGTVVALKWKEEINFFVLIFLVLTVVFYLSFGLIARRMIRSQQPLCKPCDKE